MKKVLVSIIAYNEERSIAKAITDIREHFPSADIVLVDDCSTDATADVARDHGVKVIRHGVNLGNIGFPAVKTSFVYAYKNNYDVYCQFDGDGQHDARWLATIVHPITANNADLVIGSRFLEKEGHQSTFLRRIGIKLFSFVTSIVINRSITDVTSGFKAYNRKVIELFGEKYKYPIVDSNEILIVTHYAGGEYMKYRWKCKEGNMVIPALVFFKH